MARKRKKDMSMKGMTINLDQMEISPFTGRESKNFQRYLDASAAMSKPLTSIDSLGKYSEITGVILAGGKSTRMGTDKAYLLLHGKPFIHILAGMFQQLFHHVVISSDVQGKFAEIGIPVIPDIYNNCGPLGGIHSALSHSPTSYVFVTSCDTPLLSTDVMQYLIRSARTNEITIGRECGNIHPLIGIYPTTALQTIERYLQNGKRKVVDLLNEIPNHTVDLSQWSNELRNINNAAQYEQTINQL